jgi:hypothetical protein
MRKLRRTAAWPAIARKPILHVPDRKAVSRVFVEFKRQNLDEEEETDQISDKSPAIFAMELVLRV